MLSAMSKRTYWILAFLFVLGGGALLTLKMYSVEIIHTVVMNALVQKAPDGYDKGRIGGSFERALKEARRTGAEQEYLDRLMVVSQRLEKVQHLEGHEIEELLSQVEGK